MTADLGIHIAVVEDNDLLRALIVRTLTEAGFRTSEFSRGSRLIDAMAKDTPALAIVDLGLPDADGLTLVRKIRERFAMGVVIVSGMGELSDRVVGLEVGADDYLAKPFAPRELVARVRSVLRRSTAKSGAGVSAGRIRFENFGLDRVAKVLTDPSGAPVDLTGAEFRLLEALAAHANEVLSRDQLVHLCYDSNKPAHGRTVDIYVARLRQKLLRHGAASTLIQTIRNRGYLLAVVGLQADAESEGS